jgi:uncharacterized protein YodC (DUF2158 family)
VEVPTKADTIMPLDTADLVPGGVLQVTDVPLDQFEVTQAESPMSTVGVKSGAPKFKPVTVTDVPPDDGEFNCMLYEMTGASHVNDDVSSPSDPSKAFTAC